MIQFDFRSRIKKIQHRLLLFLRIRLHPKTSDSSTLITTHTEIKLQHRLAFDLTSCLFK